MPAEYRASNLKDEAIALMRESAPFKLLDAKAALTAMTPETQFTHAIPKTYVPAGLGAIKNKFGLGGSILAMSGLGTLGYRWNKRLAEKGLIDKLESMGRLQDLNKMAMVIEIHSLNGGSMVKQASAAKEEVRGIMRAIYQEDPSYWPYGLDVAGHDSVYLIRDNMTKAAAGFVGWQVQKKNGRKIGSYSIGILPEYRNNGFAKEAVAKVIQEKAASVDEVRSYICAHNYKSKGLANKFNIKIQEDF